MALEIKAPAKIPESVLTNKRIKKIFTAGSIEMGKAEPWQDRLVKEFPDDNVLFMNPRRDDWDSTWKQDPTPGTKFHEQVTWELAHIEKADIVVFYFDPKTQSPITLMELGLCLGSDPSIDSRRFIVCCPDGYFRKGNVVITCKRHGVNVVNTYEDFVKKLKAAIKG